MKYFLVVLLFLGSVRRSNAQTSAISGRVYDEKHLTLPGATVFLTGTKSITGCDNNGFFKLDKVATGTYQLVVKMMGFKPFIQSVTLTDKPLNITVVLKPDNFLLKEVKIRPDYDRVKHMQIFIREFLGETYNSKLCKILNPDALYFTYNKKTEVLTAAADDIIEVQNNALGYKIKYVLADFEYNEGNNVVTYEGYPSFTEMNGTREQQALWETNRRTAYLGSINHFIRSIYNNRSFQEGFEVYKLRNRPPLGIQPDSGARQMLLVEEHVEFDSLLTVKDNNVKSLSYKDCLYVVFKKEKEPANYADRSFNLKNVPTSHIKHNGQSSLVYLQADAVDIDDNGLYSPASGLFFEGYWSWEKNADLMPLEYTASSDEKKNVSK